jgi:hypothetical protein
MKTIYIYVNKKKLICVTIAPQIKLIIGNVTTVQNSRKIY